MLLVRIGLVLAAIAYVGVAAGSWAAGFPPEVAVLRGFVGAAAVLGVAYLAELLVATSPRRTRAVGRLGLPVPQSASPPGAQPRGVRPLEGEVAVPGGSPGVDRGDDRANVEAG